ncbi:pre-peptidase C family protein [Leptolyngbyaceae cyanobacterium JSC-12]|nr:pre-peptidase C family protein [Leptolyngbyaceae cyanobacterium JSC-12]
MGFSLETATPLTLRSDLEAYVRGKLTVDQPEQFYKVNLQKRSDLIAILQDITTNADLYVLDASGSQLSLGGTAIKSENTGVNSEYINARVLSPTSDILTPGVYYIKVALASSSLDTDFSLRIEANYARAGDVVFHNGTSGNVYFGDFDGTTWTTSTYVGNAQFPWVIDTTGDLNNDGIDDLVWRDTSTGTTAIWQLNAGHTVVATPALPTLPLTAKYVGVGDMDSDGHMDLLVQDSAASTDPYSVWFMNGTTLVSAVSTRNVTGSGFVNTIYPPPNFQARGFEDMDNNGTPDFIFENLLYPYKYYIVMSKFVPGVNYQTRMQKLLTTYLLGTGVATSGQSYPAGIADFDDNGVLDIASYTGTSLRIVLLQNPYQYKQEVIIPMPPGNYPVVIKKPTPGNFLDYFFNSADESGLEIASPLTASATFKDAVGSTSDPNDLYYFDLYDDSSSITLNITAPSGVSWELRRGSLTGTTVDSGTGNLSQTYTSQPRNRYYLKLSNASTSEKYTFTVSLGSTSNNVPVQIDNVIAGNAGSNPREFVQLGSTTYFVADSDEYGTELFKTDGTTGNTSVVDIVSGASGSNPTELTNLSNSYGSWVYFKATDVNGDTELYRVNTTGNVQRFDLNLDGSSNPTSLTALGPSGDNLLYFGAYKSGKIRIWATDGSTASDGPNIRVVASDELLSFPTDFTYQSNNNDLFLVYFIGDLSIGGKDLFAVEFGFLVNTYGIIPEAFSVSRRSAIEPGSTYDPLTGFVYDSSNPTEIVALDDDDLYVIATQTKASNIGTELFHVSSANNWTAPTPIDILSGSDSSNPSELTVVKNGTTPALFFAATGSSSQGRELWKITNANKTSPTLIDIRSGSDDSNPTNLTAVDTSWLYFSADNSGSDDYEAFRIQNTSTTPGLVGTTQVNSSGSSDPYGFTKLGSDQVFWAASDASSAENIELFRHTISTNSAPTKTEIRASSGGFNFGSNPSSLFAHSSTLLLMAANTVAYGNEPYTFTTTTNTASLLKDLNLASNGVGFSDFVVVGSNKYFIGPSEKGTNLWVSTADTSSDTSELTVAETSDPVYDLHGLVVSGNMIYGVGYTPGYGYELDRLDTTVNPPVLKRMTDIEPGEGSSNIDNLVVHTDGYTYFSAYKSGTGTNDGNGIWRVNASTTPGSPGFVTKYNTDISTPITSILSMADFNSQAGTQPGIFAAVGTKVFGPTLTNDLRLPTTSGYTTEQKLNDYYIKNTSAYVDYASSTGSSGSGGGPIQSEVLSLSSAVIKEYQIGYRGYEEVGPVPLLFVNGVPYMLYQGGGGIGYANAFNNHPRDARFMVKPGQVIFPFFNDFVVYENSVFGAGYAFEARATGKANRDCPNYNEQYAIGWEPFGMHFGLNTEKGYGGSPKYPSDSDNGKSTNGSDNPVTYGSLFGVINPATFFGTAYEYYLRARDGGPVCPVPITTSHPSNINPGIKDGKPVGSGAHGFHSVGNGRITFLADAGDDLGFQLYAIEDKHSNEADVSNYTVERLSTDFEDFGNMVETNFRVYFIGKKASTGWQVWATDGKSIRQVTSLTSDQIPISLEMRDRAYYTVFDKTTRTDTLNALS